MSCFYPRECWPAAPPAKGVVFAPGKSYVGATKGQVPCGACIGCRVVYKQHWTTRLIHERASHVDACFVTLTLEDEHYPACGGGQTWHIQAFMRRLRKAFPDLRIRFFAASEYGETTGRLHYHALLYGVAFADRQFSKKSKTGEPMFTSATLDAAWRLGFATVQDFTEATAAYVAGYAVKKIGGKPADEHYWRAHPVTGELVHVRPEFSLMSRKPGIGGDWFKEWAGDCFPSGFLVEDGRKVPVPKAYRRMWDRLPEEQRNAMIGAAKARASSLLSPSERVIAGLSAKGRKAGREEAVKIAAGLAPSMETREEALRLRLDRNLRDLGGA